MNDSSLGVFELISKKDFSTVNNPAGAAAAAEESKGGEFDFDNFQSSSNNTGAD